MTSTPLTDTITWAPGLDDNLITVYFAPDGYSVPGPVPFGNLRNVVSEGFNDYEITQFMTAFDTVEAVINVEFVIVTDPAQADLTLVLDTNEVDGAFLGVFNPPGVRNEGIGIFDGTQWDRAPGGDLEMGGYGYVTIVHELLHGLGLAHPHDDGGGSTVMPGVTSSLDDFGDNDLNQGIYTTMTYNSGWFTGPAGTAPSSSQPGVIFGFEAGPMAIDIAALQAIYGANTTHAAGNNVYLLDVTNGAGTYWSSIWDTGGIDEIRHTGSQAATIDLRPATLEFEDGGGGFVSHVAGVAGGFTVAHDVVIENATGGSGADRITGNNADNVILGNSGNDRLLGGSGNDTLGGGGGDDSLFGGFGEDVLFGGYGNDNLYGEAGSDVIWAGTGNDLIHGGTENDTLGGGQGADSIFAGAGADVVYGSTEADVVHGEAGNDTLFGGAGNDTLSGGAGDDELYSGAGTDVFVFAAGHGNDSIGGFETNGDNTIDVSALGLSGFSDLTLNQEAGGVLVQTGEGSITLWGTVVAEITADDFIF